MIRMRATHVSIILAGLLLTGCTLAGVPGQLPIALVVLLLVYFSAACRDYVQREDPLLAYIRLLDSIPDGEATGCSSVQDFTDFDLATELSSTGDGFKITGIAASYSGYDVNFPGDLNGDGINDIITSGYGFDNLGRGGFTGGGYVIYGQAGRSVNVDLSAFTTTNGFRLDGAGNNYITGEQITTGDVNGDGIDDALIVAKNADHLGKGANTGAVYLVYGKSGGSANIDLAAIPASDGLRIDGVAAGDQLTSVGTADLNDDGIDDIVIGARNADPLGRGNEGAVYVIYGRSDFSGNIDLAALSASDGFIIAGESAGAAIANRVTSAGDMNADGVEDLLFGSQSFAPGGKAWVVYGQAGGRGDLDLAALTAAEGVAMTGASTGDSTGLHVVGSGDFNGDGLADFAIDARGSDLGGTNSGAVYLVLGKATGLADLNLGAFTTSDGYRVIGQNGAGIGTALALEDLNNDGLADLVVGAKNATAKGANTGEVYAIFGRRGDPVDFDLNSYSINSGFTVTAAVAGDGLGYSTAVSDVNGDACPDLIMGAAAVSGDTIGRTYILYGGREQ
jgi:hypothetical protein